MLRPPRTRPMRRVCVARCETVLGTHSQMSADLPACAPMLDPACVESHTEAFPLPKIKPHLCEPLH